MKNKKMSVISIIIVLIVLMASIKYVKSNIFNSKSNDISNVKVSTDTVEQSISNTHEEYSLDKMELLNTGDEGIYERIVKNGAGKVTDSSVRYRFKNIDSGISKEKPENVVIDFYGNGFEQRDDNETFTDDSYYVTVTYEVTNIQEEGWRNDGFYSQNFLIGYYDELGFHGKNEPRGFTQTDKAAPKGAIYLEKDESIVVTNCYCVKKELLEKDNVVVQALVTGEKAAIKMPYFIINTDGVAE